MSTMVGEFDIELLFNDLGQTKRRLWVAETQLDCAINFLKAILSKEDGEMLDAYLDESIAADPIEFPKESTVLLSYLRAMTRVMREADNRAAIENIQRAAPCRLEDDPLLKKSKVSGKKKKANVPAGLRG